MTRISYVERNQLDEQHQQAYDKENQKVGVVTNMKKTILHSLPAHQAYTGSYLIKAALIEFLGKRTFNIYAHAISSASNCLLCSLFFRKQLIQDGIDPKDFTPTEEEQLLIEVGSRIGNRQLKLGDDIWHQLRQRYSEEQIVNIIGFAGTMIATNIFNSVLEVELDDYLQEITN